jgi:hypothetical protein
MSTVRPASGRHQFACLRHGDPRFPAGNPLPMMPAHRPPLRSVDAIKVEITQSVTIAFAGEVVDEHEEVTGSISEPAVAAVEPVLVIESPGHEE